MQAKKPSAATHQASSDDTAKPSEDRNASAPVNTKQSASVPPKVATGTRSNNRTQVQAATSGGGAQQRAAKKKMEKKKMDKKKPEPSADLAARAPGASTVLLAALRKADKGAPKSTAATFKARAMPSRKATAAKTAAAAAAISSPKEPTRQANALASAAKPRREGASGKPRATAAAAAEGAAAAASATKKSRGDIDLLSLGRDDSFSPVQLTVGLG